MTTILFVFGVLAALLSLAVQWYAQAGGAQLAGFLRAVAVLLLILGALTWLHGFVVRA